MEQFSFEDLDITRASNETIAELGEVLWHFTSVRCKEDLDIAEKYRESVDALVDSFNPKQKKWFEEYQKMVTDELWLAEQWFLLCTKRPVKPFIFQNRRKPQIVAKDDPSDDNVFFKKEYIYGVDSRCNAGYGLWQLAFGSTGEADMPAAKA